ncbi:MAG: DUF1732 domain-containing protein [Candidatus Omnitrophica bacterium]|nr:DUF1732 domain-containing protein [Candidatus Omnitrophota bacterium]MBU2251053.1 DUF1732 domain-containing protein [Candidatus Omnitrophota bacterium]MBU2473231.1 DUF1732 domain-containing protein [Candidatus Omnitrophota bacterium]
MKSMTAYAACHKRKESQTVQIVLRSMNFKYLDISVRNLPAEDILLEEEIKREVKKSIFRGKLEVFIFLTGAQSRKVSINEKVVLKYLSQIKSLARKHAVRAEVNITDLVSLPQAVYWEQRISSDRSLIMPAVKETLRKLLEFKEKEGRIIRKEMLENLKKLAANMAQAKKHKPLISAMENGKEDIDEEISLSAFYLSKLKGKINSKNQAPKGKAIDFLTQEILRELNAASSKTKKKIPALMIVEAKNYLERVREQAQNIE